MGRRVYPLPPWWRIVDPLDEIPDDHDLGRSELDPTLIDAVEIEPLIESQWDEYEPEGRR
jgi:hypothetical protein